MFNVEVSISKSYFWTTKSGLSILVSEVQSYLFVLGHYLHFLGPSEQDLRLESGLKTFWDLSM